MNGRSKCHPSPRVQLCQGLCQGAQGLLAQLQENRDVQGTWFATRPTRVTCQRLSSAAASACWRKDSPGNRKVDSTCLISACASLPNCSLIKGTRQGYQVLSRKTRRRRRTIKATPGSSIACAQTARPEPCCSCNLPDPLPQLAQQLPAVSCPCMPLATLAACPTCNSCLW